MAERCEALDNLQAGDPVPGWLTLVEAEAYDPRWPEDEHPWGITEGRTITVWPGLHTEGYSVIDTVMHELGHVYLDNCLEYDERPALGDEKAAETWAVCHGSEARWWILDEEPEC